MKGVNHRSMSENNKYQVLKAITTHGPLSRTQLCKYTNLSKMTITNFVNEYIQNNIVEESGQIDSHTGRKPALLKVIPDSLLTLGICFVRDHIEVGIIDLRGCILRSVRFPISPKETLDSFLETLLHVTDGFMTDEIKRRIWGIGVSCMGPLDNKRGIILNPPGFHGYQDIPILPILTEKYGIPAYLQNDVCVSALSEIYYGNPNNYEHFFYINVSAWVGGSVVLKHKLYTGNGGLAGIIGHVVVDKDHTSDHEDYGGRLQRYSSISAIEEWARENGPDHDVTWNILVNRARNGDAFANQAIDRMLGYLEIAIINAVDILDPQCVYISGDILFAEDLILHRLSKSINHLKFAPGTRVVSVLPSTFPTSGPFIGTAALVMENHFNTDIE